MIHFNPLNGKVVGSKKLGRNLLQACLLHHTGEDHIKPILLVTEGYAVELEPTDAAKHLVRLTLSDHFSCEGFLMDGLMLSLLSHSIF
jgi:hypothetical protein